MYLSNKDLFNLELLYADLKNHVDIIGTEKLETLSDIIKKIETQKERKDKFNAEYMREKRKNDKTYGRSFTEKQRMLGI
jgi:hypothetical protein